MSSVDPIEPPELMQAHGRHAVQALVQFLRIVRHRKRIVVAALTVSGLLGALYFGTAERLYQSRASLLVLQTGGDVMSTSITPEASRQGLMPTYERLVSSAVVLEGAIGLIAPEHRTDVQKLPREEWTAALRKRLSASTARQTNIIEVAYTSRSPSASAAIVDAVLESYLDFLNKTSKGTAGEIITVLTKEKVQLEEKLSAKEAEVLQARQAFGDLGIRAESNVLHPVLQRAIGFNEALVKAQQKRLELQASMAAIQHAVQNGQDLQQHVLALENSVGREFLMSGLGLSSRDAHVQAQLEKGLLEDRAELKSLMEFYGPAHPKSVEVSDRIRVSEQYLEGYQGRIEKRLQDVRSTQLGPMLTQMMQQRLNEAMEHETFLRNSFEVARTEAIALHGDLAKVEILEHDLTWLRNLRDVLLNQIASVDLKQGHGDIRTAIVSEPTIPTAAVSPKLSVVFILCLFGGLGVGLGAVYVLDLLDDRFRSPEDLREQLQAPVLAMIRPLADLPPGGADSLHLHVSPESVESEAFRTLRTTLAFSQQETSRLVVSSAEPGDGKTTVTANLAVSYAQAGNRVLLLDADLRRPGLSALLGLKGLPGLSDLLTADGPVAQLAGECMYSTGIDRFEVIPAGTRRSNPAELLSGPRLAELLSWAEGKFDQILIDCPPAMAASDASIVARLVDGVILVVQPQKNQRRTVLRAADSFAAVNVNLVGAVLNRIEATSGDMYGYGYGYGYGHDGYGESHDERQSPNSEAGSRLASDTASVVAPISAAPGPIVPRRVA